MSNFVLDEETIKKLADLRAAMSNLGNTTKLEVGIPDHKL